MPDEKKREDKSYLSKQLALLSRESLLAAVRRRRPLAFSFFMG
jgi:hypothetical protein